MKTTLTRFALKASVAAVNAALLAAASTAHAADSDAALIRELTQPTNMFEVGIGGVSQSSYKFGQYNGLYNNGPYAIGNFDWRGGRGYDPTSGSAERWSLFGTDLGLTTRTIGAEYAVQGQYRLFVGYDELRSNFSDSYQTPYQNVGSNNLVLPSYWTKPIVPQVSATGGNFRALSPTTGLANAMVGGVVTPPTAAQQAIVNNVLALDVPAFQNANIQTTRKTVNGGLSWNFMPGWQFYANASQTDQDGLKTIGMLSLASGTSSGINPMPINQNTNQYNAGVSYTGEKLFFTAAYYGSFFRNDVDSMSWENPFAPGTFGTMSTNPSNDFNQFTIKGGYNFTPVTKLVMGFSYGRATQDQSYLPYPGGAPIGYPVSSPNAEVVTTMFNARLTTKPAKDWNLAIAYKYNERDNKTPVNTYAFYDANEPPTTTASFFNSALGLAPNTLYSNINIYANRPYSSKQNQFNADADYLMAKGQSIKLGYQWQDITRNCNGTWINCADATSATTNSFKVAWDGTSWEAFSAHVDYEYAQRRVDYNENGWLALVPMAGVVPANGATLPVANFLADTGLGGYGPIAPWVPTQPGNLGIFFPNNSALPQANYGSRNDIHELPGMRRYAYADRDRNRIRGTVNWDATEKISLTGNLEYVDDDYSNSVYGLQSAKNFAGTLEANFALAENFSANAFYTYEEQKQNSAGLSYSAGGITNTATVGGVAGNTVVQGGCFNTVMDRNMNAKIDPCLNWTSDMKDAVNTLGGSFKYTGLMSGKLDLSSLFLFSYAKTNIVVNGGTYQNSPYAVANRPAIVPATYFIQAEGMPTVKQNLFEFQLAGLYNLDKVSAIRAFYWFQRLQYSDYAYDGMQFGTLSSVMPTNQTAPNYNVNVFGVSYIYKWQ